MITILQLIAVILFVVAAAQIQTGRVLPGWAGLAFLAASFLVSGWNLPG